MSTMAAGRVQPVVLPCAPSAVAVRGALNVEEWRKIGLELETTQSRHQIAGERGRAIQGACKRGLLQFHLGDVEAAVATRAEATRMLEAIPPDIVSPKPQRAMPLLFAIEQHSCLCATLDFVRTGLFPSVETMSFAVEPNEYVAGLLGCCQELSRYATGRAAQGDVTSVALARDAVAALNEALLKFDFRNGPLRRQYDGLKYALRHLEDVLYEQSLVGRRAPELQELTKQEGALASLESIRVGYEENDAARERVIKLSRDVQKGAKQCIFALHRNDLVKAKTLLLDAESAAAAILEDPDLVLKWPSLRFGSLSASLEEFAEAALFAHWLEREGAVATIAELSSKFALTTEEYLGGVADLTGEVGRLAVAAATKRDVEQVRKVHATDLAVLERIATLNLPSKLHKKMDPLNTNLKKLETLLYELSLAAASATPPKRKTPEPRTDGPSAAGEDDVDMQR